jgi:hypothetical protein
MRITGQGIHGKIGSNLIAGLYSMEATEDGDNLDATTGADGGGLRDDTGCSRLTCRISGYFDIVTGTVAPVRRGTDVANLNLYVSASEGGPKAYIGEGKVQTCQITGQVRERVTFTATIVSQGTDYSLS